MEYTNFRDSNYWVTSDGFVFKKIGGSFNRMRTHLDNKGYEKIRLTIGFNRKSFRVHRIIAECYLGESELEVNHKNGVKNDNGLSNLEYTTSRDNQLHAIRTGLKPVLKGSDIGTSILTESQVLDIRKEFKPYKVTRKHLSNKYNVSEATIKDVVLRKSWKHL